MAIKAIIFDYDGVIVDSFKNVYEVYKKVLKLSGKECPKTLEKFKKLYYKGHITFHSIMNLSKSEIELSDKIFREEMVAKEMKLFEGIKEVIKTLSEKYDLFVLTANFLDTTIKELKREKLESYFTEIIGRTETFDPLCKTPAIIALIKKLNLNENEVILIGDRESDYRHGKEAGLKHIIIVEYGWGYNKKDLENHKQEIVVNSPKDLINAIAHIDKR